MSDLPEETNKKKLSECELLWYEYLCSQERMLYINTAQSLFFQNLSKVHACFGSIDSMCYYVTLGSTSALCFK